jgi:hypothetical protein
VPGTTPPYNVTLGISYLKSYAQMGQFSVACEEGCACDAVVVDAHDTVEKVSQTHTVQLAVPAAGEWREVGRGKRVAALPAVEPAPASQAPPPCTPSLCTLFQTRARCG